MIRKQATLSIVGVGTAAAGVIIVALWGVKWMLLPLTFILAINVVMGLLNMRAARRHLTIPEPPENVRVIDRMGIEIPVQCIYVGRSDGFALWEVIRPQAIVNVSDVRGLAADVFPAKTRIVIRGRDSET